MILLKNISLSNILLFIVLILMSLNVEASNRVALVIGNSAYAEMPLKNSRNDAFAMQQALQQSGFKVVTALDANLQAMQQAMLDFVAQLNANSTALVFYAGHGIQANGRNYLLPLGAKIDSERSLRFEALELTDLLEELETSNARIKIVVLDACRNNPFEKKTRGSGRGLAAVDAARGTLIAYATSPGATASDGEGDHGLYTQALLDNIRKPGLKVEEVFKKVRITVANQSQGAQIPWESSSLTGDFIFNGAPSTKKTQPAAQQSVIQPAKSGKAAHEAIYWESVQNSDNIDLLQAYIDKYPAGYFVSLAKLKQATLRDKLMNEKNSLTENAGRPLALKSGASTLGGCEDLSGRWKNIPATDIACAPTEFRVGRVNKNQYEIHGAGCGVLLTASAYHSGKSKLIVNWKMSTCSGTTTYKFNEGCTAAEGDVKVNRHLLCLVQDTKESIRKLSE